jgi:integrase
VNTEPGNAWIEVDGKTGPRRVALDDETADLLRPLRGAPDETVLGVSPGSVGDLPSRHLRHVCDALKVRRFTLHGLRLLAPCRPLLAFQVNQIGFYTDT